ncbi:hypothetical protein BKA63DRAFT_259669 [Paraphoma chrysanthemicola]|nr:hypothetical protein BKA63DRAFT_259669 [Paraphoma chrysanthemicola]
MSFKSTILAFTAFMAIANAHIKINTPVPFSKDTLDTAPITKSQFPCKSNLGFKVSQMNQMAVGSSQKLAFDGTAVHGGGSCQLAITTDPEPSANSVFKVIKSIEGGCPGVDGTNSYEFTLPDSIPNGKATFAWTWFAKLSGAPEMYMNCAPIEVTGGASDDSAFKSLPDMFVANLDDTCKSPANKAVKFPTPGAEVQTGSTNDVEPPTGSGCGKSSGTTPADPSSPAGQPSAAPQSSAVAQPSAPAAGQSSAAAKPSPTPVPSNGGGVFAPGASSAPLPAQTSTTLITVTAPTPAKPTVPSSPGSGTPAVPSSPSTGGGSNTTCSSNGAIVCNGEKQFGLCNNGNVVWQDVAAGTACVNGVISKRSFNSRVTRPRYRSPRVAMPVGY